MKASHLQPGQRFRFIGNDFRSAETHGQAVIVNERGEQTLRWVHQKTFEVAKFHPADEVEPNQT